MKVLLEEKESLKQAVHEQTLRQIETLGANTSNNLQKNITRLAEIENERYVRR